MYVSAIVVAAGKGKRFNSRASKAVFNLNSKPLVFYALNILNRSPQINEIIVVANKRNINRISSDVCKYKFRKVNSIILGGKERQDSVSNGLKEISEKADLVLIHDAARPFINNVLVSQVINAAKKNKAAILGVKIKATIKESDSSLKVKRTLDRNRLWEIQTPQVFNRDIILKAYKKFSNHKVTDDSMLVERLGVGVKIVPGSYSNIKITTPEDIALAKMIIKK